MRNQECELCIIVIIDGLEHFCQPNGWKLYTTNFEPKFFISVLTDETGRRFYCACLTFSEAISRQSLAGNSNRGNYYAVHHLETSIKILNCRRIQLIIYITIVLSYNR